MFPAEFHQCTCLAAHCTAAKAGQGNHSGNLLYETFCHLVHVQQMKNLSCTRGGVANFCKINHTGTAAPPDQNQRLVVLTSEASTPRFLRDSTKAMHFGGHTFLSFLPITAFILFTRSDLF